RWTSCAGAGESAGWGRRSPWTATAARPPTRPDETLIAAEATARLGRALAALPAAQREAYLNGDAARSMMRAMTRTAVALAVIAIVAARARADEGMWTFDRFPAAEVKARYGFFPDAAWLDHVRLSSARTGECSAGFVSASGLVITNHHCAR